MHVLVQVNEKAGLCHRGRTEIIASILQEAKEGATKTHIMYRCNLSFGQLRGYLDFLIKSGFLESMALKPEDGGCYERRLFETTSKGKAFIKGYLNLTALLVE